MAANDSVTVKGTFPDGLQLWAVATWVSDDIGANTSNVDLELFVYRPTGNTRYPFMNDAVSRGLQTTTDNGTTWTTRGSWISGYNFTSSYVPQGKTTSLGIAHILNVPHNADGSLSLNFRGYFYGSTNLFNVDWTNPPANSIRPLQVTATGTFIGKTFDRYPNTPVISGYTRTTADAGTITVNASATVPSGASAIDYYQWSRSVHGASSWSGFTNAPTGTITYSGLSAATDYDIGVYSHNGAGFSTSPATVTAWAPPQFTGSAMPIIGIIGKPYTGQLYSTAIDTFAIQSGSLPDGLALVNGTVSGVPTTAGVFTFTVRGTRTSSSATTDSQTFVITVFEGSPKVRVSGNFNTRSALKVYDNGWKKAWMRIYDASYTDPVDGTHWRPIL